MLLYYREARKDECYRYFVTPVRRIVGACCWFRAPDPMTFIQDDDVVYWNPCKETRYKVMKRHLLFLFVLLTLLGGLMISFTQVAHAQTRGTLTASSCITPGSTHVMTNTLPPDGASYIISVPSNWNG